MRWIPVEMVNQVSQEETLGDSIQAYIWTATKQSELQRRRAGIVEENRTEPAPCGRLSRKQKWKRRLVLVNEQRGIVQACKYKMNSN